MAAGREQALPRPHHRRSPLLAQLAELPVVFVLALLVNRPSWPAQQELFERHGYNVVLVTTMISAAGVFTGCSAAPA